MRHELSILRGQAPEFLPCCTGRARHWVSAACAASVRKRRIAMPATTAVGGAQGRRQGRGVEPRKHELCLVEAADQQQPADLEIARIAALTRSPCSSSVAGAVSSASPASPGRARRGKLGFGNDASCAGYGLFRTEATCRAPHERFGANEIAELRHRDAAQRERRRVVSQGDPLQRAKDRPSRVHAPRL